MAKSEFTNNANKLIHSYNSLKKQESLFQAKEKELGKRKTGKKVKDENGKEVEEAVCNWLLHYLYTFQQFNYRQDLGSFKSVEQLQRFDYGKEVFLRERLSGIRTGIEGELGRINQTLIALRDEVNAQEVKDLLAKAEGLESQLLQVDSVLRVTLDKVKALGSLGDLKTNLGELERKVGELQIKVNNLPLGSTSSSLSVEQVTKEAIRKIMGKLSEL